VSRLADYVFFVLSISAGVVLALAVFYAAIRLASEAWHKGREQFHRRMRFNSKLKGDRPHG